MHLPLFRRLVTMAPSLCRAAFALVILASADGCTPKSSSSTASTDAATGASSAAPAATGKRAAVPADVCALLSAADVGAILGEKVEARPVPGGGCQYPGGTRASLYPTISIAEDFAGAGGIEGARTGGAAATGGVATPLTVGGAPGYVVTGARMGSTTTQAAVAIHGLLATVTLAGGEKTGNEKIAASILKLAIAKL